VLINPSSQGLHLPLTNVELSKAVSAVKRIVNKVEE
jgi:hypothetical protein